MPGGRLLQFDIPDAGDGVGIDDELVAVGGGCADVGLGIEFIPHFQPGGYCVFIGFSADVQPLTLRHGCFGSYPAVYRPSQRPFLRLRMFPSPLARFFDISIASYQQHNILQLL